MGESLILGLLAGRSATQAGSPRKEKQAGKSEQGVQKEKYGGNWRKIGEEVGEKKGDIGGIVLGEQEEKEEKEERWNKVQFATR